MLGRNCYWICDDRGGWIPLNETQFKRDAQNGGVSPKILEEALRVALRSLFDRHSAKG